jgi:hypothetical protein
VALYGDTCAARCAAYGGADVRVHAGYDNAAAWGKFDHDPALLAGATARAIHVPEIDADHLDVTAETAQRQPELLLEVSPQVLSDFHTTASNL